MAAFRLRQILAAVALVAPAGSVFAADAARPLGPAVVVRPPWNTVYAGVAVGLAEYRFEWDNVTLTNEPVSRQDGEFVWGGQVGFTRQFGAFVIGAEAAVIGPGVTSTAPSSNTAVASYTTEIGWLVTGMAKAGFTIWNASLLYAQGGVAWAPVTTSGVQTAIPDSFSQTGNRTGWAAGVGFAHQWQRLILGWDYKYVDLGTFNRSGTTATAIPFTITGIHPTAHVFTVRASYKFI
jgi:opacity protein-like surface antigen